MPILVTSFSFGYLICFQLKIHQSAEELYRWKRSVSLESFRIKASDKKDETNREDVLYWIPFHTS